MRYARAPLRRRARVLDNRTLGNGAFELTLERGELAFDAGQEVWLHGETPADDRRYSLASGEGEPVLRLLIREIPGGALSPRLARLAPGDEIELTGPSGSFRLRDPAEPALYVATGTGIAPALSFLRTHPGLPLTLVHGLRTSEDLPLPTDVRPLACIRCVSRRPGPADVPGRVTDWLRQHPVRPGTAVYLCGANGMILEARRLLRAQGCPERDLFAEAYYV